MALTINQQILEQIESARHILIITSEKDNGSGTAAGLALSAVLAKMDKPADIIVSEKTKQKMQFLPQTNKIKTNIDSLKKFIISVDTANTKISEFSYDATPNKLNIFITPKSGSFSSKDVSFDSGNYKYDLIFVISCPDMESIGNLYQKNTDFFYNTSIINIDSTPANEHFGQINLIDLNCASSSEIIFSFLKSISPEFIDEHVATNLLAGIIIETNTFKSSSLSPKTLTASAELIKLGADRQLIVNSLYRNKTLATFNLWGRVLARLKQDSHYKLAWSMVSQTDFAKSNATPENLQGVVEELLSSSPTIEIVLILYETESGQIAAELHTTPNYNALELALPWNPIGTNTQADFYLETSKLLEAEAQTIDQIRTRLNQKH